MLVSCQLHENVLWEPLMRNYVTFYGVWWHVDLESIPPGSTLNFDTSVIAPERDLVQSYVDSVKQSIDNLYSGSWTITQGPLSDLMTVYLCLDKASLSSFFCGDPIGGIVTDYLLVWMGQQQNEMKDRVPVTIINPAESPRYTGWKSSGDSHEAPPSDLGHTQKQGDINILKQLESVLINIGQSELARRLAVDIAAIEIGVPPPYNLTTLMNAIDAALASANLLPHG
jgi:hypothetical protein